MVYNNIHNIYVYIVCLFQKTYYTISGRFYYYSLLLVYLQEEVEHTSDSGFKLLLLDLIT